jgi:hypothetical protein
MSRGRSGRHLDRPAKPAREIALQSRAEGRRLQRRPAYGGTQARAVAGSRARLPRGVLSAWGVIRNICNPAQIGPVAAPLPTDPVRFVGRTCTD